MEYYWSHYAKVMEFNRQRILLQNPEKISYYDIPNRLMPTSSPGHAQNICSFTNFQFPQPVNAHTIDQSKYNLTSSPVNERVGQFLNRKAYKKRKGKKARKRQRRLDRFADNQSIEDQSETMQTEEESVNASDIEFVIDDGFMKFLEISMEHKFERKRKLLAEKQRETLIREEELAKGTNLVGVKHQERKAYKNQLYGTQADKIMAMENAMDISLNQQKDLYQPVLWPNIALNLKF